jgi:hypothetical protein
MVFRFVTKRFGRLRKVWILTQAFDAGLAALSLVTAPSVARAIRALTRELLKWPDVLMSRHPLGGRQFNWRGTELGHVHSNGIVDLRGGRGADWRNDDDDVLVSTELGENA